MPELQPVTTAVLPVRSIPIGTGSGCVALALASERPKARVTATDISQAALQVAGQNAVKLHLSERVCFLEGDLFVPVQGNSFDLVVSNPPYVARSGVGDLSPELAHEPETALFGGQDGLEIVKRLVAGVGSVLEPGGVFALEIDPAQERAVHAYCNEAGLRQVRTLRDLTKRPRVVTDWNVGILAASCVAVPPLDKQV